MASYFDLPPQSAAPADVLKIQGDEYKGLGLLSPQVSRILDDFDFEDGSSSDEGEEEEEEPKPATRTTPSNNKTTTTTTKFQPSPRRSRLGSVELVPEDFPPSPPALAESGPQATAASSSPAPKKDKASKPRHANMERFKSLRSVLFLSKIEDNMNKMYHEEQTRTDAAQDWRAQHDKRQGLNRPATPDKEKKKDETEKETAKDTGLTTRVATKIRRMASHGTPTMEQIPESTAPTRRDSTATDTDDDDDGPPLSIPSSSASEEEEEEDADIIRWTTLADPPSGSDASHAASPALAPTDIPSLLQHVRRLSLPSQPAAVHFSTSGSHDSDESTASDSDDAAVESEDEDADELVRWVSRRDGALAGPVRAPAASTTAAADGADRDDEDVTELNPWTARSPPSQRRGRTAERSGSVSRSRSRAREAKALMESGTKTGTKKGLCDADVDELVQWVSRRDSKACVDEEEVRGRGRGAVV
jgi:hypothetical protein